MLHRRDTQRRRGAALVEFAMILPVLLLLTLGTIVGALGVFRHQQIAAFAREGARYAVVHGGQYHKEQGGPLTDANAIMNNVITPRAAGFDPTKINVTVTYDQGLESPEYATTGGGAQVDRVTVTVSFVWQPEFFFPSMTLTSTSQMLMWY